MWSRHQGTRLWVATLRHNLAATKAGMQAETLCDRLFDVEAEALVVMLADTLSQAQAKTLGDTLAKWRARQLSTRLLTR